MTVCCWELDGAEVWNNVVILCMCASLYTAYNQLYYIISLHFAFIQCFDTVGWMIGISPDMQKPGSLVFSGKDYLLEQVEEQNQVKHELIQVHVESGR